MFEQLRLYYHSLMFAWSLRKFYSSIGDMMNHAMAMGEAMSRDQKIDKSLGTVKGKIKLKK